MTQQNNDQAGQNNQKQQDQNQAKPGQQGGGQFDKDQNRSGQQGGAQVDKNQQSQSGQGSGQQGSQVGKDTDNDGRPVKPGSKPGEVDGDKQNQKNR